MLKSLLKVEPIILSFLNEDIWLFQCTQLHILVSISSLSSKRSPGMSQDDKRALILTISSVARSVMYHAFRKMLFSWVILTQALTFSLLFQQPYISWKVYTNVKGLAKFQDFVQQMTLPGHHWMLASELHIANCDEQTWGS